MRILLDQNISFRIVQRIAYVFPEVAHVKQLELINANDFDIFIFARRQDFDLVFTQDEDFYNLLLEHGPPPKIVWLRTGNCSTAYLADVVLQNVVAIKDFADDPSSDCLEIYGLNE